MRKKLFTILALPIMLIISSGVVYAYFTDIGTTSGNVLGAGTLDLKLSDADETSSDSITASFGGVLAPGDCSQRSSIMVRNVGSISGDHIDLSVTNSLVDEGDNATDDIDTFLEISELTFDENTLVSQIEDVNENGIKDLDDLEQKSIKDLTLTDTNTDHTITMLICLSAAADNTVQGDQSTSSLNVTLFQKEE